MRSLTGLMVLMLTVGCEAKNNADC